MRHLLATGLALVIVGGCRDAASPGAAALEITTDRAAYAPLEAVVITTRNTGTGPAYDDHCGGGMVQLDPGPTGPSGGSARACALGHPRRPRVEIAPGTSHVDTFHVSFAAPRGSWRVELALLDAEGRPLPGDQRTTPVFRVESR